MGWKGRDIKQINRKTDKTEIIRRDGGQKEEDMSRVSLQNVVQTFTDIPGNPLSFRL